MRANLRPNDFLVEVADSLNEFMGDLEERRLATTDEDAQHEVRSEELFQAIDFEDAVGPQGRGPAVRSEAGSTPASVSGQAAVGVSADFAPEPPRIHPATPEDESEPSQNRDCSRRRDWTQPLSCRSPALPSPSPSAHSGRNFPQSRSVAQPGSAPAWGAGGRRFKSSRSDQL